MSTPLKCLFLEDSPNDLFLVQRRLRDVATVDVAMGRDAFAEMLKEDWAVIMLDWRLHDMTCPEAVELVRKTKADVPLILVTGSITDEAAASALRLGFCDYLRKDRLERLPHAVLEAHKNYMLRQQSIRDQRLEIMGQLSAGLVHDFNGILAVLMMGVEHLRTRITPQDEKVLDTMLSATKRGGEMTGQFLAFVRGSNGTAFKNVAPEYLLGEVETMVRATFPANIRVEIATALGTSQIKGDATQLAQVLANLATNARDAMVPQGGVLKIRAQNAARAEGIPGPCVVISVEDTGTGIPEEALPHIWTPFFSTKRVGEGTGLGLPTVKRIVEAHHGTVTVETSPKGTTFTVALPLALPWTVQGSGSATPTDGVGRTVLLVDDQQSFRDLAKMILEGAGYTVLTAANGPEALHHFRVGQQIDVLLTDLSMSPMDGTELARNLRSVGLTLPIVYLSGYDATAPRDPEPQAMLQKPVDRDKLLRTLADVLTRAGEGRNTGT